MYYLLNVNIKEWIIKNETQGTFFGYGIYVQSDVNITLFKWKRKDGLIILLQMELEKQWLFVSQASNTDGQNGWKNTTEMGILHLGNENFF